MDRVAGGEIAVYEAGNGETRLEVRLEQDTVWLDREQLAQLFGRDKSVIGKHLRAVYREGELDREATAADFAQVRSEGARTITRQIEHYNLDAILSVGYRVKSKRGVQFRIWATNTLREHLVRGYTLNERRLAERGLDEARATLDLLSQTLRNQSLLTKTGQAVLDLITGYADTWRLLVQYDEDEIPLPPGSKPASGVLEPATAAAAIASFRRELMARREASALFGNERSDEALASILGNIEQTMFGEPLYRSREEKAAHLLYFVVKDHPFTDGNKRIASLLFLLYLAQENVAHELNPQALTALTLLVAESEPLSKDLMIRLVMNLLAEPGG